MQTLPAFDIWVLALYLAAVVGLGCWLARRNRTTNDFMAAGGTLPGWAVGLSVPKVAKILRRCFPRARKAWAGSQRGGAADVTFMNLSHDLVTQMLFKILIRLNARTSTQTRL